MDQSHLKIEENMKQKIFSYGMLQYESVQVATFGRKLTGKKDALIGYQLSEVTITDPYVIAVSGESVHKMLTPSNNALDYVNGMVFDITAEELAKADKYEVSDYKRVLAKLSSGDSAWVYVQARN